MLIPLGAGSEFAQEPDQLVVPIHRLNGAEAQAGLERFA